MRKLWILPAVAIAVSLNASSVFAYSYAEKEDPMTGIFKAAIVDAKNGKWDDVSTLAKKGVAMQKGHIFEANDLEPRFKETINNKDVSKTAELFANLVYLSIREKLHKNKKENFSNHKNAKARLQLARKSYLDVLDGNVKKQDADRSSAILQNFNLALDNIGNPGLFGIGKKEPDKAEYDKAVNKIEALIAESFPSFSK